MSEPRDQRDLLIRYLLGVASATERTIVEEQYLSDDASAGVLLRAEDELIDDYVRGVLSDSDRRLFESHFLCTEARKQRLETVKSLVDVLGQMELSAKSVSSERPRRSLTHAERPSSSPAAIAHKELTPESFTQLLNWLDSDYQRAAEKLLNIRDRLIKLFAVRGVRDAEGLADETVDRVARKIDQSIEPYVGDPANYFYGVARHLMMESARARDKRSPLDVVLTGVIGNASASEQQQITCLDKCLAQLPQSDRDLVLRRYDAAGGKKLDRDQLAQSLGISPNALRIRVHRIRQTLKKCIESCLQHEQEQRDDT